MNGILFIKFRNNSSLCIPRKCISKAALLTADIDTITSEKRLEDIIDTLSNFICKWNITKIYKDNPTKKEKEGNCQDFVHDLLEELNIKPDHIFQGALGNFLSEMKKEGKCVMEFQMTDEFREKFQIKDKKIRFKTHEELDKFVLKLMEKEVEFELKHKSEWILLKSFDRSMWLRYFKFKEDTLWKPLFKKEEDDNETLLCPFDDPETTGSLRFTRN